MWTFLSPGWLDSKVREGWAHNWIEQLWLSMLAPQCIMLCLTQNVCCFVNHCECKCSNTETARQSEWQLHFSARREEWRFLTLFISFNKSSAVSYCQYVHGIMWELLHPHHWLQVRYLIDVGCWAFDCAQRSPPPSIRSLLSTTRCLIYTRFSRIYWDVCFVSRESSIGRENVDTWQFMFERNFYTYPECIPLNNL